MLNDRIDAVRLEVNELLIEIIMKNPKDWCDQNIIPRLVAGMKENTNYIKKQNILYIIEVFLLLIKKTAGAVSEKTFKDVYQNVVSSYLGDKVPNVRIRSIELIKKNSKLSSAIADKQLEILKDDKDV